MPPHPQEVRELSQAGDRVLVLYDGQCGFCSRTVRWLVRRDGKDRLRFAASQSTVAGPVLARHGLAAEGGGPGTIVVVRNVETDAEEVLVRSTASLALLAELPQPWPAVGAVLRLVPRAVRDAVYGVVARNRHRLGGAASACPLPTAEEREHFL